MGDLPPIASGGGEGGTICNRMQIDFAYVSEHCATFWNKNPINLATFERKGICMSLIVVKCAQVGNFNKPNFASCITKYSYGKILRIAQYFDISLRRSLKIKFEQV